MWANRTTEIYAYGRSDGGGRWPLRRRRRFHLRFPRLWRWTLVSKSLRQSCEACRFQCVAAGCSKGLQAGQAAGRVLGDGRDGCLRSPNMEPGSVWRQVHVPWHSGRWRMSLDRARTHGGVGYEEEARCFDCGPPVRSCAKGHSLQEANQADIEQVVQQTCLEMLRKGQRERLADRV